MTSNTVFELPISKSSAWIFNCYIIDTGTKLVVIDPGLPIVARRALERDPPHLPARGIHRSISPGVARPAILRSGPRAEGWEAIHAPGHTDDSTCFYHADSETLISGDAVISLDGRAWFNPEYVDTDLAHSTEARLRSLKVRHLLPGHGDPIQATDVWRDARSFITPPTGNGVLARCSRRFGKWPAKPGQG